MVDHPIPASTRQHRATRAAVLVTLLALVLLVWEAVAKEVPVRRARGRRHVAARARPQPPPRVVRKRSPARIVPTAPATPPAPPRVVAPVDPTTLRVSDILIDPSDPAARFAVIDGVAVRAGEVIGGHTVRAVLPDRVLIGEEGEGSFLPFAKDR